MRGSFLAPLLPSFRPGRLFHHPHCRYIRKKGAFYNESLLKTVVASGFPFLLPVLVWTAPTVLFYYASHNFNAAFRVYLEILSKLAVFNEDWTAQQGLDVSKLVQLVGPSSILGEKLLTYEWQQRVGSGVCSFVLLLTFFVRLLHSFLSSASAQVLVRPCC